MRSSPLRLHVFNFGDLLPLYILSLSVCLQYYSIVSYQHQLWTSFLRLHIQPLSWYSVLGIPCQFLPYCSCGDKFHVSTICSLSMATYIEPVVEIYFPTQSSSIKRCFNFAPLTRYCNINSIFKLDPPQHRMWLLQSEYNLVTILSVEAKRHGRTGNASTVAVKM